MVIQELLLRHRNSTYTLGLCIGLCHAHFFLCYLQSLGFCHSPNLRLLCRCPHGPVLGDGNC